MSKKPKTDKRLDKLFKDFQPEEATSKEKREPRVEKDAVPADLKPASKKPRQLSPAQSRPLEESLPLESVNASVSEKNLSSYSVTIPTGFSEWSTLRILDESQDRKWTADEQLLVQQVSDQLSLALENARLFQEAQERAQELNILNEMALVLSAETRIEQICKLAYQYTSKLINTTNFFIALYEERIGKVRFPIVVNDNRFVQSPPRNIGGGGLTDYVITNKETLFIPDDVDGHMRRMGIEFISVVNDKPAVSWLGTPLLIGSRSIGAIVVQSVEIPNLYTERERDLLLSVSSQVSTAIENARLLEETQRRANEMSALAQIGRDISSTLNTETVLKKIVEDTLGLLRCTSTAVYIPDADFKVLQPIATAGVEAEEIMNDPLHIGIGILGNMAVSKKGEIANNVSDDPRATDIKDTEAVDHEHLMGVPILVQDNLRGVLAVWRVGLGEDFSESEFSFLANLAQQIATSLENARLFQEAQKFKLGIDRTDNAVFITDPNGIIQYVNPGFNKVYGFTAEEAIGKTPRIIKSGVIPSEQYQHFWGTLLSGGTISGELVNKTKDGRIIPIAGTNSPILDENGKVLGFLAVHQDITDRKKYEEDLRRSQEQYALAAEGANDGLWDWDIAGNEIYYSPRWKSMLGYEMNELTRGFADWEDLIHPEDHDYAVNALDDYLTGKAEMYDVEIRLRHKDGTWRWIRDRGKALRDENGKATRMAGSHSDVTDRKIAEESIRRRNEYLAASSEIGKIVTSTLDVNTIFARTVNLINDRFGFYHAGIFIVEETGFNAALREATGEAGAEMKKSKHSLQVNTKSIVGKVTLEGNAIVVNDVSADPLHKFNPMLPETRAEAAIPLRIGSRVIGAIDIQAKVVNAFTEDEVTVLQTLADQVAVAIDNARSYELSQQAVMEMREIDRLKSQFLANMSHELRTPLNSIIGFSRVILKGIDGPITELQQQDLTAIYNSGSHLLSLINDILDLSKIEAGKMELAFDEVNITDVTNSVLSTMTGLVKDKPVELKREIEADLPTVRADAIRVRQVMINLLSNAAKFTDEGNIVVQVGLRPNASGRNEIQVSVTDTGPGISEQDQTKLFQPFSQVDDSPTRKTGGTGLGLSICQHLISMHGGRIWVESQVGKGSTFYFTLPLFRKEKEFETTPILNKMILAIDDDPQVVSLYERYLQPQGYQVVPLSDPSRAVERAKQLRPFAITLDIMMPGIDGWQVLDSLKGDPDTRHIPVIVCSIIEDLEKGFSLGAADYLVKPILEDDLVNALDRLNSDGSIREVLVIDDDPNDLRLIGKILEDDGRYKSMLVEGGKHGWDIISSGPPPHAVILDLFMPEMDGFTILENMRSDPKLRDIPVIVISGLEPTEAQKEQLREFGQRLLTKGAFSEKELLTTIQRALERAKAIK